MKFIIKETNETKELHIYTSEGIDWTEDLIGNSGAVGDYIQFDAEADAYRIDEENYNWWSDYIDKAQADQEELDALRAEYGSQAVNEIIAREGVGQDCDYDCQHDSMQEAFRIVRQELGEA